MSVDNLPAIQLGTVIYDRSFNRTLIVYENTLDTSEMAHWMWKGHVKVFYTSSRGIGRWATMPLIELLTYRYEVAHW